VTGSLLPLPDDPDKWEIALRNLQRAVRAYALGLGNEVYGWERIIQAEREARELISKVDNDRHLAANT